MGSRLKIQYSAKAGMTRQEAKEKALAFIKRKPGCDRKMIAEAIGLEVRKQGRHMRVPEILVAALVDLQKEGNIVYQHAGNPRGYFAQTGRTTQSQTEETEPMARRKTRFSPTDERDKKRVKEWILNCIEKNPGVPPTQIAESIGIPCTTRGCRGLQVPSVVTICLQELRDEGEIKHIRGDRRGYYLDSYEEPAPVKLTPEKIKEINMRGVTTYYVPVPQLISALNRGADVGELPKSDVPLTQPKPIAIGTGKRRGRRSA